MITSYQQEALNCLEIINGQITEINPDTQNTLKYCTDGYEYWIEFMGIVLWSSEDPEQEGGTLTDYIIHRIKLISIELNKVSNFLKEI